MTIGGCFLLTEDHDLSDPPGLGVSAWLQVAHAAASEVEYASIEMTARIPLNVAGETIGAVSRRVAAASPGGKLAFGIVAAGVVVGAIWLVKSGKADKFFERARSVVQELGRTYGPPLIETVQRHTDGQVVFRQAVVPRAEAQTLGERIAQVLAYSSEPLLAVDIARNSKCPGTCGTALRWSALNSRAARRSRNSPGDGGYWASRLDTSPSPCRWPKCWTTTSGCTRTRVEYGARANPRPLQHQQPVRSES